MTTETVVRSFAPIAGPDVTVLILGSMPGVQSLQAHAYYAHPRNAFWKIIEALFAVRCDDEYQRRCEALVSAGVAVWDVLGACERPGSLDASIDASSAIANDFNGFFESHRHVQRVLCNGGYAYKAYCQKVLPGLAPHLAAMRVHKVPSTSPAHASLSVAEKTAAWRAALTE